MRNNEPAAGHNNIILIVLEINQDDGCACRLCHRGVDYWPWQRHALS